MKWLLLCCLCVTGCLELPAAPVVLIDLPPSRVENLAPVPYPPAASACPRIVRAWAVARPDSVTFYLQVAGARVADHGRTWSAQWEVDSDQATATGLSPYGVDFVVRGTEEQRGLVPVRRFQFEPDGSWGPRVGYGVQRGRRDTLIVVVPRALLGASTVDYSVSVESPSCSQSRLGLSSEVVVP